MQIGLSQLVGGIIALALLIGGSFSMGTKWKAQSESVVASVETALNASSSEFIDEEIPVPEGADYYKVLRVVDGDTIAVEIDGASQTIRLIGIDTPELHDSRTGVQCFAQEAANRAKELLAGARVTLEVDLSQGEKDKYRRRLAYVFREDGLFLNRVLIAEGYGEEYTYNEPYKYQKEFKAAQVAAKSGKRGLWAPDVCPSEKTAVSEPGSTTKKSAVLGVDVSRAQISVPLEQPQQTIIPPPPLVPVSTAMMPPPSITASTPVESLQTTPVLPTSPPPVPETTPAESTVSTPVCTTNTYNCTDFKTQQEAQDVYNKCGGLANDVHKLDKNKDGHPCDSLP